MRQSATKPQQSDGSQRSAVPIASEPTFASAATTVETSPPDLGLQYHELMLGIREHDSLGNLQEALRLADDALVLAMQAPELISIRQAHNALGMLHYRLCKFDSSANHLLLALHLAQKEGNVFHQFCALANIACLLESLGMIQEALELSRRLCLFPTSNLSFLQIHFQNAVNGLKFGYKAKVPSQDLEIFLESLKRISQSSYVLSDLEAVYLLAGRTLYAIRSNASSATLKELGETLLESTDSSHVRIKAVALFTRARISLALCEPSSLAASVCGISGLLPQISEFPEHFEEALELLVTLNETLSQQSVQVGNPLRVATLLREHLILVKKRTFIEGIHRTKAKPDIAKQHIFSQSHNSLEWLTRLRNELVEYIGDPALETSLVDELHDKTELASLASFINAHSDSAFDRGCRSEAYDMAENWAMASELRGGGSGETIFAVGQIAYLTARGFGCGQTVSVKIGMACRLRNIAYILTTTEHVPSLADARDDDFVARQHAAWAATMLERSGEKILRSCAKIIKHHHEWWNGCGYPDGLRGDSIPLGSRICAYADVYVSLIAKRPDLDSCWTSKEALDQVASMGGMQLDPHLLNSFRSATRKFHGRLD